MASVSLLIPSLPGANREAAEAWDALATHAGKQASVCRYGAELADRTRRSQTESSAGGREPLPSIAARRFSQCSTMNAAMSCQSGRSVRIAS